jgi:general secretion pathway protein G
MIKVNFNKLSRAPKAEEAGFTLIELLIVIAVIGMIGTLVATNVMGRFEEAKIGTTKEQIRSLGLVLDDFKRVCNFYPTTDQGLDALTKAPQGRECKNYPTDNFTKHIPKDGWGNDYVYESDGNKYVLKSLGADNAPGGTGNNQDISSDDP